MRNTRLLFFFGLLIPMFAFSGSAIASGWDLNWLSLHADPQDPKYKKAFEGLVASKVPDEKSAGDFSFNYIFKIGHAPAAAGPCVIGLYQATGGVDQNAFARSGDWVWLVEITELGRIDGFVAVNARTGKTKVLNLGENTLAR